MNIYCQQTCHDLNALLSCHFYDLLPFFMLIVENTSIQQNQNSMNRFDVIIVGGGSIIVEVK